MERDPILFGILLVQSYQQGHQSRTKDPSSMNFLGIQEARGQIRNVGFVSGYLLDFNPSIIH